MSNIGNLEKAKIIVACSSCGKPTIGWKDRSKMWHCKDCRGKWRALLQKRRRDQQREQSTFKVGDAVGGRVSRYQTLSIDLLNIRTAGGLPGLGELRYDGDKIQCHLCGQWYFSLASHIFQTHHWSMDEYREEFSLNRRQPLIVPSLSFVLSKESRKADTLRKSGYAGLYKHLLRVNMKPHFERRQQTLFNLSDSKLGMKLPPASEERKRAQRANYKKALIQMPCALCGKLTLGHKAQSHAYCDVCRPIHKKQYLKAWQNEHRQYLRAYWKKYDEQRRQVPQMR